MAGRCQSTGRCGGEGDALASNAGEGRQDQSAGLAREAEGRLPTVRSFRRSAPGAGSGTCATGPPSPLTPRPQPLLRVLTGVTY